MSLSNLGPEQKARIRIFVVDDERTFRESCAAVYSKTKGLFAGIDIAGTKWEIDSKSNEAVYGPARGADVGALLAADGSGAPAVVHPFVRSLRLHVGSATP